MNKKPTAKEFQWDKPHCTIDGYSCSECFEPKDYNGRKCICSNCKIAFKHKNKKEIRE